MKKQFEEPIIELLKLDALEATTASLDVPSVGGGIGDEDDFDF